MDTAEQHRIYKLQLEALINAINSFRTVHGIMKDKEFLIDFKLLSRLTKLEKDLAECTQ